MNGIALNFTFQSHYPAATFQSFLRIPKTASGLKDEKSGISHEF